MQITKPCTVEIPSSGIFAGRKTRGVFFAKHGAPENLGLVQVETKILQAEIPKNSLLLSEGLNNYTKPENLYLDRFVAATGINAVDPIVCPYTVDVATSARISKIQAALSVLVDDIEFIYGLDTVSMSEDELQEWINRRINFLTESFDLKPNEITEELEQLKFLQTHEELKFHEKIKILSAIRRSLIDESNIQSRKVLETTLASNKQFRILVVSGAEHTPVFLERDN